MNWLIRILTYFTKPIEGDSSIWLERSMKLRGEVWIDFLCGSCRGVYRVQGKEYQILAVQNTKKNDNFDKVLGWFYKSCKRDGCTLSFLEIGNPRLLEKLRLCGFEGNKQKMTLIP